MKAVIETGGKQYIVAVGTKLQVEKLDAEVGQVIKLDKVLFLGSEGSFEIGKPTIEGRVVEAKVLSHGKGRKIHVLKYKNKSKYRRKIGHRQQYTELEIAKI